MDHSTYEDGYNHVLDSVEEAETQADKFNAYYNFMNIMGWDVKEIIFNDDSKSRYGYDFLD